MVNQLKVAHMQRTNDVDNVYGVNVVVVHVGILKVTKPVAKEISVVMEAKAVMEINVVNVDSGLVEVVVSVVVMEVTAVVVVVVVVLEEDEAVHAVHAVHVAMKMEKLSMVKEAKEVTVVAKAMVIKMDDQRDSSVVIITTTTTTATTATNSVDHVLAVHHVTVKAEEMLDKAAEKVPVVMAVRMEARSQNAPIHVSDVIGHISKVVVIRYEFIVFLYKHSNFYTQISFFSVCRTAVNKSRTP